MQLSKIVALVMGHKIISLVAGIVVVIGLVAGGLAIRSHQMYQRYYNEGVQLANDYIDDAGAVGPVPCSELVQTNTVLGIVIPSGADHNAALAGCRSVG
jgi:hypothetical protein